MHCNSAGALFARRRSGSKRTMRPAAEMERIRMKKSIVIGALLLIALALPFAALAEGDAAEIKESTCSHNGGFTANGQNGHIWLDGDEENADVLAGAIEIIAKNAQSDKLDDMIREFISSRLPQNEFDCYDDGEE